MTGFGIGPAAGAVGGGTFAATASLRPAVGVGVGGFGLVGSAGARYGGSSAGGSSGAGYGGLSAGGWLQAGGAVASAIGSYFDAEARKNELKSQALALEHQSAISAINARIAEFDAQQIEFAGRDQAARLAMQYAQAKGAQRASAGARGVVGGVGSAAEVGASIDLAAEVDRLTINTDTALAAGQRRMEVVNQRNAGTLARASARNLRGSASSIYPALAAGGSLLQSGAQFAMAQERRRVR